MPHPNSPSSRLMPTHWHALWLSVTFLTLVGCSDNPLGRMPISGRITFDGQPLDVGTIDFRPPQGTKGVGSGAAVRAGIYQIEEKRGLPPGKYEVRIFSSKEDTSPLPEGVAPGGMRPGVERLPPKVNLKTELVAEVTADGPNEFVFDISSR